MDFGHTELLRWIDDILKKIKENKKVLIISVSSVALVAFIIFGHIYYKNRARAEAYKDFMTAIQYYDGAVKNQKANPEASNVKQFDSENDKWAQTERIFKQGYQDHKNTEMGTAFLAFQSEALLNLGKVDEAIKIMKDVIDQIKSVEIKDLYRLKIALICLDKKDENGLNDLIALANNENSTANEIALYQVGSYFWNLKKYNEAKDYWQRLLVKTTVAKTGQSSIYAGEVREKLMLISAENL